MLPPLQIAPMSPIISIKNLSKTYATGFTALKNINLDIRAGEIFALLGPNGFTGSKRISTPAGGDGVGIFESEKPFRMSLSKPCIALGQAQPERFKWVQACSMII